MTKIRFELIDEDEIFPEAGGAEVLLLGENIASYLVAFKSFLIACGFSEENVSEIQTLEDAYYRFKKEQEQKDKDS